MHTAPGSGENRILKESVYLPLTVTGSTSLYRTVSHAFDGARKEIEKVKKAREEWDKKQEEAKKAAEEAKKKEAEKGDKDKGSRRGTSPKKTKVPRSSRRRR